MPTPNAQVTQMKDNMLNRLKWSLSAVAAILSSMFVLALEMRF
jgi:hypothetical protein